MSSKIWAAFTLLLVLQALHSLEEFIFKFYDVFPPMVFLYRRDPHLAKTAFVVSNVLLLLVGMTCLLRWVWPSKPGARTIVGIWTGGEALNAAAHSLWAILIRGYNPGLVTALGFVPIVAYLSYHRTSDRDHHLTSRWS